MIVVLTMKIIVNLIAPGIHFVSLQVLAFELLIHSFKHSQPLPIIALLTLIM